MKWFLLNRICWIWSVISSCLIVFGLTYSPNGLEVLGIFMLHYLWNIQFILIVNVVHIVITGASSTLLLLSTLVVFHYFTSYFTHFDVTSSWFLTLCTKCLKPLYHCQLLFFVMFQLPTLSYIDVFSIICFNAIASAHDFCI